MLVVGGQSYAVPFTDTNPSLPAELFDPTQNAWRTLAPIAVPRTYHSIALLLPDATVLAGGGGLCGKGVSNFFWQFFSLSLSLSSPFPALCSLVSPKPVFESDWKGY